MKSLKSFAYMVSVLLAIWHSDVRAADGLETINIKTNSSPLAVESNNEERKYYPPSKEELSRDRTLMNQWVARAFPNPGGDLRTRAKPPLSFRYGGVPSDQLVDGWDYSVRAGTNEHSYVASYADPRTGLRIDCEVTTHPDAAAVDWLCYLSNTGAKDSLMIEQFMPLDAANLFDGSFSNGAVTLRWSNGDTCAKDAFFHHDEKLERGKVRKLTGISSMHRVPAERAKDYAFPFFNLQVPGGGMVLAVGWTGKWQAEFGQNTNGVITLRAGMQNTHFVLKPGERVRTPRLVLLRWSGSEMVHGHNQFRRMMLNHYTQWRDGKPAAPPVAAMNTAGCWIRGQTPLNEKGERAFVDVIASLGCEAYWLDAYWYVESLPSPGWMTNFGNWYASPKHFPNGVKPVMDAAHAKGLECVLWFIPIVASKNTRMATDYPQHFYSGSSEGGLWKLADPVSRDVLINWMAERKREWGFDIWRDDGGNAMPAETDPNRRGIEEMKYYEGLYKFWDGLFEKMPTLLIDNTSGGGNRIDLESSARSFCQWRSDFNDIGEGLKGKEYWPSMALADQVMVAGLFLYLPFHSGPVWDMGPYSFRSAMTSGTVLYNNLEDPKFPFDLARQGITELKELRPYFLGDVYPLLPLDLEQTSWYAYQLDRPDLNEGCAFFFRRPNSPYLMVEVILYNINPRAEYLVSITGETYESGPWKKMRGKELIKSKMVIPDKPGSSLLRYKQIEATN